MEPHAAASSCSLTFKSLGRLATKRRATTLGHDTNGKRRKYDFSNTTVVSGNDDINDSVDWSAWSPGGSQIRNPQPEFNLDSSDDDDDDDDDSNHLHSIELSPTMNTSDLDEAMRDTKFEKPSANHDTYHDIGEDDIEVNEHRDLITQLADELSASNKKSSLRPLLLIPTSDQLYQSHKERFLPPVCQTSDGTRNHMFPALQDNEPKPCSLPPQRHESASCQPESLSVPRYTQIRAYAAEPSVGKPGLGFQLKIFRKAFENERQKREMQCLLDRLVALRLHEEIRVHESAGKIKEQADGLGGL